MDTAVENAMIVHKQDGTTMKFKEHTDVLYYFDIHANNSMVQIPPTTLVNTVLNNKNRLFPAKLTLPTKRVSFTES
jgi:hypothetical protein